MTKPANAPNTPDEAVVRVQPVIRNALCRTVDLNVATGFEVGVSVQIVTAAAIGAVLDLFCTEAVARGIPLDVAQDRLMSSVADTIADQRARSNPNNIN
jgi:hypothetical protein